MSAPEPVMGWVAAKTERIHIGTAINSLSPRKDTRSGTPSGPP